MRIIYSYLWLINVDITLHPFFIKFCRFWLYYWCIWNAFSSRFVLTIHKMSRDISCNSLRPIGHWTFVKSSSSVSVTHLFRRSLLMNIVWIGGWVRGLWSSVFGTLFKASLGDTWAVARYWRKNLYSSCFQFLPSKWGRMWVLFTRVWTKRSASPLALGQ